MTTMYDNTKSLMENAKMGVDITDPTNLLDDYNMLDFIYDKLANNTDYPMFEPEMVDSMELVYDANTHKPDYIAIELYGKEYRLTLTKEK